MKYEALPLNSKITWSGNAPIFFIKHQMLYHKEQGPYHFRTQSWTN